VTFQRKKKKKFRNAEREQVSRRGCTKNTEDGNRSLKVLFYFFSLPCSTTRFGKKKCRFCQSQAKEMSAGVWVAMTGLVEGEKKEARELTVPPSPSCCKRVLLLYTGGTMGMRHQADGSLAPEKGYLTDKINELPEMKSPGMPDYTIKEYEPLLDSSQMGPKEWAEIATDIERDYLTYDGFVVIMGTDTMAYCSSALSFMLENLGKTVVFTGSQIPFCEVYTDARHNLLVSILFAASSEFPEVCICFNDRLMRANRTVKTDSVGLNAFDSPNYPYLATLGAFINERKDLALPQPRGPFRVHKTLVANILVLKLVPGFDDEAIYALIESTTKLKALVLEMYGTGNGPSNKQSLLAAIEMATKKGIVVVAISQCLKGGVSLDTYSMGREFKNRGVVSGGDMTTEACTTKLAYLFSRLQDPSSVARQLGENIRGEITANGGPSKKFDIAKNLISRL